MVRSTRMSDSDCFECNTKAFGSVGASLLYRFFHVVQEAIKSNVSNNWVNGSVGAANWQASESSSVGLTAYYNDLYYNDTGSGGGIRLFYGVGNSNVHELIYSFATREWTGGYSFAGVNGDAGKAFMRWGRCRHLTSLSSQRTEPARALVARLR